MAGKQKEEEQQQPPFDDEEEDIDDEESEEEEEKEEEEEEEESQSPLSKVARVSSPADPSNNAMTAYAPPQPPVALGLGLGVGVGGTAPSAETSAKPSFTFMQRQELHHHLRVFDYIVRRAPVPLDLVLPIWKSVAASYGPHHYPSFVGLGNLCYDFRNSMEPEPGRCRRTDGKKWRCSRDVIPNEKYCERHMHRGRVRSRKPVEASVEASPSAAADGAAAASASVSAAAASLSDAIPTGSSQAAAAASNISGNADTNAAVLPPRPTVAVACKSQVVVEVEKLPG